MSTYSEKLKSPAWQKRRLSILNRDNFTCRYCESTDKTLNVHHLGYGQDALTVSDDLLITLCESCHEIETEELANIRKELFNDLRNLGLNSTMMMGILRIFGNFHPIKDRGWLRFEPAYDIINTFINDDELWEMASDRFWNKLDKKENF